MEVNRLVADLQLVPPAADLPAPSVDGLEPLLTVDQLCAWTGYSRKTVYNYRQRPENPLPAIGTASSPRFLPSAVLDWMRDEATRTAESQSL